MNYDELLVRIARQDQQAFKALHDELSPVLFHSLFMMLNDRELAEDVLQDAFFKIWLNAGKFSPDKAKAVTWIGSITRNTALDQLRWMKRRHYQDEEFGTTDRLLCTSHTPAEHSMIMEDLLDVLKTLSNIKSEERKCIILACHYGYSHNELAKLLQTPLGTIKSWIKRGKVQIRGIHNNPQRALMQPAKT